MIKELELFQKLRKSLGRLAVLLERLDNEIGPDKGTVCEELSLDIAFRMFDAAVLLDALGDVPLPTVVCPSPN